MDLADTNNEVVAVDDEDVMVANDEEVFCVSSSWSNAGCRFINDKVANDMLLPSSHKERVREGDHECFNMLKGHLHFAYWCCFPCVDIIIVYN